MIFDYQDIILFDIDFYDVCVPKGKNGESIDLNSK